MTRKTWNTSTELETQKAGEHLATVVSAPCTILLTGDLGTGKTVFARGLAIGLGIRDPSTVHSPTFSLVNQYDCEKAPLYHLDLYRLTTLAELYSIGIEDILDAEAVVVIEWAERMPLPTNNPIRIHLVESTDGNRLIELETELSLPI